MHENTKKHLEHEINTFKIEAEKQRTLIAQLERERDRYINDAAQHSNKAKQVRNVFQPVS